MSSGTPTRILRKDTPMMYHGILKNMNGSMRVIITAIFGIAIGFFIGVSLPHDPYIKLPSILSTGLVNIKSLGDGSGSSPSKHNNGNSADLKPRITRSGNNTLLYIPTNPRGAETLAPGIIVAETDLYLRRLWGRPEEDLVIKPKYLAVFTVGIKQKNMINYAVTKFSENFTILLFHYDGKVNEWDEFEWSRNAIHISARKQTKWWYAKRFLHPDVVASYDYIFIWDEDLGVEHFNAEEYIRLVRKYGLDISQPALEPNNHIPWLMTRKRTDMEVHKNTTERPGWCRDPYLPPCAGFVEIMAPVFSRKAWRCVWHLIQNDLVHGWGLDLALGRCAQPAHEKIGVVDAQWIVHNTLPSLGNEGESTNGRAAWEGVRERCQNEWGLFRSRMDHAEQEFLKEHSHN